ncbi:MAG: hypothetical protein ABH852_01675 [Methanobacteriota archaeon]
MTDKITSVAGLREWFENKLAYFESIKIKSIEDRVTIDELRKTLEKISEFEAGLWKLHDLGLADAKTIKLILTGETELRRVLGEGAEG